VDKGSVISVKRVAARGSAGAVGVGGIGKRVVDRVGIGVCVAKYR
jgi:hypothetical protein